jgi:hypothetical protein
MKKIYFIPFVCLAFSVFFLYSCNNIKNTKVIPSDIKNTKDMQSDIEITSIVYRFGDSSVPPPYHRSYRIIVNAESFRFVVDSYGDVVKDTTVQISKEKWESCKNLLNSCKIQKGNDGKEPEGCTGGTTKNIQVLNNDKVVFEAGNYYCGGQIFGDLKGDVETFVSKLKDGISGSVFLHD